MKPILIEIDGFNSFATKQIIDFEKLISLGLFGIFGKTGSGKTTILDAIIYALYANIPRGANNIINADCKKASVRYIFSIKGTNAGTYEIQRTVSKGKSEDEMMLSKADSSKKAKLMQIKENKISVIADTKREVDKKIIEIIGLDYEDFIKTVVLPQGEFSAFLKEKNKDRKDMLERLFSLQKYGDELSEKIKKYKSTYEIIQRDYEKELSSYENINSESIEKLQKESVKIQEDIRKLEKKYQYLNDLEKEIILLEKYKFELDENEKKLKELQKWSEKIEDIRKKCQKLEKLTSLQETIQTYIQLSQIIPEEKTRLKDIQEQNEKFEIEKEKLLKEKEEIEVKLQALPDINTQIQDIQTSIEVKLNMNSINQKKDKLLKYHYKLENSEKQTNSQILKLNKNLHDINEKIQSQEEIIEKNTVKSSYKETIRKINNDISLFEQNFIEIENINKEIQFHNKESLEKIKQIEINKKLEKDLLSKLQNLIIPQNTNYTMENYENNENNHKKLESIRELLIRNTKEIQDNEHIFLENKNQIENLNQNLKKMINQKEEIQKNLEKKQKEDLVSKIKSKLKEGDECPVCHGTYHINENEIRDIITDENILTMELENIIDEISKINSQIAILTNQNQNIKNQNVKLNNEIQYMSDGLNFKSLDDEIEKCLKYKENYREYLKETELKNKELKEKENSLNEIQKNLSIEENNINTIQKLINSLDDKLSQKNQISENLKAEIDEKTKQINIPKEQIKEKLKQIIESEQIIEQTAINLNKDKKTFLEIQENIKKSQIDLDFITKQITNSKIEEEKLNSSIKIELSKVKDKLLLEKENLNEILKEKQEYVEHITMSSKQNNESIENINSSIQDLKIQITQLNTKIDMNIKIMDRHFTTLENFKTNENYGSLDEIFKLNEEFPKLKEKQSTLQNYDNQLNEVITLKNTNKKRYDSQKEKLDIIQKDEPYNKESHISTKSLIDENRKKYGYLENQLEYEKTIFEKKKDIIEKSKSNTKILDEVMQIEKLFKAKAFVQFLSKYQLNYVCKKASEILENISAGRFELSIDEDGEFIISDFHNGGIRRLPATLSGGETFLVSLSLALALSSQIQLKGNAPLEFFFMDEGFGTLDSSTLDTALECLKKLKNKNLSIGIISHIEKIKEFVPIKLEITQDHKSNAGSMAKIVIG